MRFPRSMLGRDSLDFSFSGLKTSVMYRVRGVPGKRAKPPEPFNPADVAAAFQAACVDTLIEKLKRAIRRFRGRSVIVGGGVSANRGLRQALMQLPLPAYFPKLKFCTDNGAMTAGLANSLLQRGEGTARVTRFSKLPRLPVEVFAPRRGTSRPRARGRQSVDPDNLDRSTNHLSAKRALGSASQSRANSLASPPTR